MISNFSLMKIWHNAHAYSQQVAYISNLNIVASGYLLHWTESLVCVAMGVGRMGSRIIRWHDTGERADVR